MTPDEMLDQAEDGMRKLTVEYDAFFGGRKQRPSADLQWRIENYFRLLSENSNLKVAQRYRLSQLMQRYAVNQSLWRRKLEVKESGWRRASDRLLAVAGAGESSRSVASAPACDVELGHGAEVDAANIERLYSAFVKARERSGSSGAGADTDRERFRSLVQAQAASIRREKHASNVQASVTLEDGRVKLRLKPGDP
ncbi:MAG: MXAN_5187 C-terminal domain-containing protein [Terriglobales bacterium]